MEDQQHFRLCVSDHAERGEAEASFTNALFDAELHPCFKPKASATAIACSDSDAVAISLLNDISRSGKHPAHHVMKERFFHEWRSQGSPASMRSF